MQGTFLRMNGYRVYRRRYNDFIISLFWVQKPYSPRRPDLRYFIKAESFSTDVTNTDDMIDEVKRLQNCEISSFHIENEDLKELMNNYNIFKQRCFNEYQEAFKNFGKSELIENTDEQQNFFHIIQRFIYNTGNAIDVDAARLQMFIDSYTVSDVKETFDRKKLRKFDASNLPPCKSDLLQQFLRANYICTIWNNAHLKTPTTYQPANNGWILENNKYHFK
ncbi:uncharacterized protein TNCT_352671 [Trichonephila clavata]|uniref:Uncharacterized protein n=1 Tax=Trichonephila clavata TaxID=2740835 RepID=A0A8X6GIX3_TRICU|nr:uncharacterized protein TNCT_352671 [Trichonephila clavata]